MSLFLTLAYLFFLGSTFGWGLEVLYRRFFSKANPEKKWINPGLCTGPYLPLYGTGLCLLYLGARLGDRIGAEGIGQKLLLLLLMAATMTLIEYGAGLFCLKSLHVRLWDYRDEWGNVQGIICPRFSFLWAVLCAVYYFFVHSSILSALAWLSENLAFSFVIGFFFGVFAIDVVYSTSLAAKIKAFAIENNIIVLYDKLKEHIRTVSKKGKERTHFLFAFVSSYSLTENLKAAQEKMEKYFKRRKKDEKQDRDTD